MKQLTDEKAVNFKRKENAVISTEDKKKEIVFREK